MVSISKRDATNLSKLVAVLKANAGGLWIRELGRQAGLHEEVARRLIKKYPALFEEYADFTPYKIHLKIIRLKRPDIPNDPAALEKYIKMSREFL